MKDSRSFIVTTLIFIGCLCVGFWIAWHRPLWNDEFNSQVNSIHNASYAEQFYGHISKAEGGNAPLFYSIQKLFLQSIRYQIPTPWLQGHWSSDPASQMILRINPVIFMSLSVSLIFYYFCRNYSLVIAFYSLFIYLSSYMLWSYWAEARPYALLVFLTTAQSVIFLNMLERDPRNDKARGWMMMAGINILLSLTSILSLGQILAMSVLWWVYKERDWKKYILMTLLPAMTVIFYYLRAIKLPFYFHLSPEQLIRDNIPRQLFDIFFIFLILLCVYWAGQKKKIIKFLPGVDIIKPVPYFIFMSMMLASSAVLLGLFAVNAHQGQGFPITSRYFIYLTPIGVIATTILSVSMVRAVSSYRLLQWLLIGLIGLLLTQHFLKTFHNDIHHIIAGTA